MPQNIYQLHRTEKNEDVIIRYPQTRGLFDDDVDYQLATLRRERTRIVNLNPSSPLLSAIDAEIATLTALVDSES